MDEPALKQLMQDLIAGTVTPDEAVSRLRRLPFADLGFAKVDHHRALRQRCGEAVYAPGKTAEQCAVIVAELLDEPGGNPVLLTRADADQVARSLDRSPGGLVTKTGALSTVAWRPAPSRSARVMLITAGTADQWVAEECRAALGAFGLEPQLLNDCGVAGVHRLLASFDQLSDADAIVVVAGMEGALASLVAGITPGAGRRRADLCGLRSRLRRRNRSPRHAGVVRGRLDRRGDRQRVRRGVRCRAHAAVSSGADGRSNTAWFHCFAGIAGDMALGSLLDAGADFDEVVGLLRRLPFSGWTLGAEPVMRSGIAATRAIVSSSDDVVVRTHAHILGLLAEARLPERVIQRSTAAFGALAEVEGRLHRRPPSQVHFHEIGSHDTIVDVVGTMAALEILGVDTVTASAVAVGTGTVRTSHGILPNPSPAVVGLLRGVPTSGKAINFELTTPTGAAILAATASSYGPMPPLRIGASGFGAGEREIDGLPNCTQVVIGEPAAEGRSTGDGHPVVLLEANIDDATGETLAHAVAKLLDAGAYDAWLTPVLMKKGRPGHVLSVLSDPALSGELRELMRSETGTLGVRAVMTERWAAARSEHQVEVAGMSVRMKVSPGRAKAESRDASKVASRTGMPLREVIAIAESAWRQRDDDDLPPGDGPASA